MRRAAGRSDFPRMPTRPWSWLSLLSLVAFSLVGCGPMRPCATANCAQHCLDENGRYTGASSGSADARAPAASGSCSMTLSCSAGCTCSRDNQGMPACLCTGALPPTGFQCVDALNCGAISCTNGCTCSNAATSACTCT